MTVCNMTIEAGARAGMIAPDETTFAYLTDSGDRARPRRRLGSARSRWRELRSDRGAVFDREVEIDASAHLAAGDLGHESGDGRPIDARGPDPAEFDDPAEREAVERALRYMGLEPGTPLAEITIDRVFIGSCTNSRIEDLRAAAEVVAGQEVAVGQRAGRAGLPAGEAAGRGGGSGPDLPRRRLRLARGGLLDVPGHEPRHARAGRALRLDVEPQLRGPPGPRRAHAPRLPAMAAAAAIEGRFVDIREWS